MRKDDEMVSLNPKYGIEVSSLTELAHKVKDDNPDLYAILVVLIASIYANDEKKLVKYCNSYLTDSFYDLQYKNKLNTDLFDLGNYNDEDSENL